MSISGFVSIYRDLHRHQKLAEKRSPMFSQGKVAKFVMYFLSSFVIIYLMGFSLMFSLISTNIPSMTAYEFMFALAPIIILIDFSMRFLLQQIPSQQVKPYMLLPISKYACIDFFLIRIVLSSGNLIWMFLFVPFVIMSVIFAEGVWLSFLFLLGYWIMVVTSAQLYSIFRTLTNHHFLYWILLIPIILSLAFPGFVDAFSANDAIKYFTGGNFFLHIFRSYAHFGGWLCKGNIIAWCALLGFTSLLYYINRKMQYHFVYSEISRTEKAIVVSNSTRLGFFNRLGIVGEFIRMEIYSIRRNKNVRKVFITSNVATIAFSLLCSFTSVYDDMGMIRFWLIYCFAIYGVMLLLRVMTFEGNYIERLMMGHQLISKLLQAKFIIYSVILLLPFVLMTPMVFTGKATWLMLFSYMFYTAGVDNFLFLQLAVFNKQTSPLNEKLTGKVAVENSWVMILIEFLAFTLPLFLVKVFSLISSEDVAYTLLCTIGLVFIFTYKLWLSNIYTRLSRRKYKNIESMISTR